MSPIFIAKMCSIFQYFLFFSYWWEKIIQDPYFFLDFSKYKILWPEYFSLWWGNLLVSVEKKAYLTGEAILAAYKELSKVINAKIEGESSNVQVHVIVSDENILDSIQKLCNQVKIMNLSNSLCGLTGAIQKHNLINDQLHAKYEEKRKKCIRNTLI